MRGRHHGPGPVGEGRADRVVPPPAAPKVGVRAGSRARGIGQAGEPGSRGRRMSASRIRGRRSARRRHAHAPAPVSGLTAERAIVGDPVRAASHVDGGPSGRRGGRRAGGRRRGAACAAWRRRRRARKAARGIAGRSVPANASTARSASRVADRVPPRGDRARPAPIPPRRARRTTPFARSGRRAFVLRRMPARMSIGAASRRACRSVKASKLAPVASRQAGFRSWPGIFAAWT